MLRSTKCAAVLSVGALTLAACASSSSADLGAVRLTGNVRTVSAGSLTAPDVGGVQTALGLDVLKALCADGPNVTISPSSLADALGLLDAGSAGTTRAAMAKLLHLPEWGDDVIAAQQARTDALAKLTGVKGASVRISNHVWAQTGTKPTQRYLDDVATAFRADLLAVDFAGSPGKATDAINASVDHDTGGMIKKLFDQPLDPSTVDVLTNAIVLDANWATPFDPDSSPAPFTTSSGAKVQVPMMSASHDEFDWTTAAGWQAATLPYKGNTLSAVALLPPVGTTRCSAPSAAALSILAGRSQGSTTVKLPRLKLSQTHELLPTLRALGLPADGDFSGIRAGASVSEVIQKVVMQVDEKGTKAAAATGIGMTSSAAVTRHELTFDRPFLFLVRDNATGSPLFLTWVGDPSQS